jgi:hypothetical protein
MKIEKAIIITLTNEELNAVKIVHNMLVSLPSCDATDLNNVLPQEVSLSSIYKGLAFIYDLANYDNTSELVFIRKE